MGIKSKSIVTFELRRDTVNKNGEHPITANIWVSNSRRKLSTGITLLPFLWNKDTQQAYLPRDAKAKAAIHGISPGVLPYANDLAGINRELDRIRNEIDNIADIFQKQKITYTAAMVVETFKETFSPTSKSESKELGLIAFIDQYIADIKATKNPGTIKVYVTTRNHIANFEKKKRIKTPLNKVGYGFLQGFYNYLIDSVGHINVTAAKQITTLKTFISYGRKYGHEIDNTYQDYTVKRDQLEVIALTNEEFLRLYNLDLSGSGHVVIAEKPKKRTISHNVLSKIRDVFCFSCVTGLRFSDLKQLKREHIKHGIIRLTATKTREINEIPLTQYAVEILKRYSDHLKPLPLISSQKFNDYLKILCEYAGIDEPIEIVRYKGAERTAKTFPKYKLVSAHTGRKTFATLSLEKGLNAEEVMSITGHKSYASFKRYVKVTEERKKQVMIDAWGAPELLTKVN